MDNSIKKIFIPPLVAQVNISFVDIVFVIYVVSCFRKYCWATRRVKTVTETHPLLTFSAVLSSKHTHIVSRFVCLFTGREGGEIQIIK